MSERKEKGPLPSATVSRILSKLKKTQDRDLRAKMLMALATIKQSWVLSILLEALADPSEIIREKIILMLAHRDDLTPDYLYPRLKNQPWFVKVAILKILGLRKDKGAIKELACILDDPNIEVRRQTALCLGQIKAKEGIPLLVKLLKDPSPHVRSAAEEALRQTSQLRFT